MGTMAAAATASSSRKRKTTAEESPLPASPDKAKKLKTDVAPGEKRLRRFRPKPPQSFHEVYRRAITQRFYVLDRRRCGTAEVPEEEVELTGSTGNIYTVTIRELPSCSCPHYTKGNQCKHWLYVMSRVLRAKFEHTYQLALVPSELREIFENAPPIDRPANGSKDKNRKPVEGDCPICFCEFKDESKESIVWCRAACGQNMHQGCFETWAATKRRGYGAGEVTCPFCRSVWQGDDDMVRKIKKGVKITHEGYVNVADQLGISTQRGLFPPPHRVELRLIVVQRLQYLFEMVERFAPLLLRATK
ncbi:E3 ubiquitin-protein ligase Zswim2 [Colletotrichum chlorophyti]|uniref:E3 ubiquitin-protein ligase Zswim2 n=1 Tax=Colletotrichum chlorophyti TaxID=708187 RepID=A0A1Q8RQH3_9PEZI|nr:E3 ubiquitin-protein ligase Zswim2 [Colletotrichum chlorophyti]